MTTRKRRPVSGQERQGGVTVVRGADRLMMTAVLMTSATVTATIMTSITLVAAAVAAGTAVIMAATALVTTTAVTAGAAIFMVITTLIAAAIAAGAAIFMAITTLIAAAIAAGAAIFMAITTLIAAAIAARTAILLASTVLVTAAVTIGAGAAPVMVFNGAAVAAGAVALMIWDNSMDSLRETFVVAVITRAANVMVMVPDRVAFAARAAVVLNIVCQSPHLIRLLLSKLHLRFGLGGLIGNHVLNGHPDRIQRRTRLDRSEGQNQD
jgi:hypothetical protein